MKRLFFAWSLILACSCASAESKPLVAIVAQDQAALRAAPRASAQQHALLWQGEVLEIRGERMDWLQVYDYRRERGGFVRASQVRRVLLAPVEAPELLALVRFLRDSAGSESLGIAFAAAYVQAAPAGVLKGPDGIETLDALGTMADRLARRASAGALQGAAARALAAHLEVAAQHGLRFASNERNGRLYVCYDGDAFRRVLAMPSTADQRARAVLGLTRSECMPDDLQPGERRRKDDWRVEVLDRVDTDALPAYLTNRVLLRRASVWSSLAYQRARAGERPEAAATRALLELAKVNKTELAEEDIAAYSDAAMRVNASRWAISASVQPGSRRKPALVTVAGAKGETCLLLVDERNNEDQPLTKRCTYGLVWAGSATLNREGNALAVAVQPADAWRELWIFHKQAGGWTVRVLPPAATQPEVGYAEFAGWVPGGSQVLVAREATGDGRHRRNFELVRLDNLATVRQAPDPSMLGAFQRWQDPAWKRETVSVR
ncbi:MAG: hypothetical protein WAO95_12935 [Burkholderiales bacterium]